MTHSGPNRRSADLEADDGLRGDELAQRVEIGGEFPAEDRLVGGREAPPRVAQRDADGLGADVEPREATAVRECCGAIGGGAGDHPRPLAVIASEAKQSPEGNDAQGWWLEIAASLRSSQRRYTD